MRFQAITDLISSKPYVMICVAAVVGVLIGFHIAPTKVTSVGAPAISKPRYNIQTISPDTKIYLIEDNLKNQAWVVSGNGEPHYLTAGDSK